MIFAPAFIMLLVLTAQSSGDESVNQTSSALDVKEGAPLFISCTYEYSGYPYLFWYVQQLDGGTPQLLLKEELADHTQTKREGFSAKHVKSEKSFHLQKEATEMNDSAVYFCALRLSAGYGKVTFGSGTRLVVTPNLKDSEPSVYKLQPAKEGDRNISACLITDYSPALITVGADGIVPKEVNGSVVVVKESGKETPSYGTVVWGTAKEADGCYAKQKEEIFKSESAEAATTCSEKTTGSFETDERLNLLSLTVLGLRVIFLKCVAFNLLFTFHAWSS